MLDVPKQLGGCINTGNKSVHFIHEFFIDFFYSCWNLIKTNLRQTLASLAPFSGMKKRRQRGVTFSTPKEGVQSSQLARDRLGGCTEYHSRSNPSTPGASKTCGALPRQVAAARVQGEPSGEPW